MRKDKKVSRTEEEVVSIVEWRGDDGSRKWLFVKRPDKGRLDDCGITRANALMQDYWRGCSSP